MLMVGGFLIFRAGVVPALPSVRKTSTVRPPTIPAGPAAFLGLPATPPATAFGLVGADALPPHPAQIRRQALPQWMPLAAPAVHHAIMKALSPLPAQTVGPDRTAVASTQVDGFTLAEASQNAVDGGRMSQAQQTITLYAPWGGVAYALTYHDTFYWNGGHVRAGKPYWTYWKAWDTRAWPVEPAAGHVTNYGRISFSQGYVNLVLAVPFGGQQNLSGSATMDDNGDWTAAIRQ